MPLQSLKELINYVGERFIAKDLRKGVVDRIIWIIQIKEALARVVS